MISSRHLRRSFLILISSVLAISLEVQGSDSAGPRAAWWDGKWPLRKKIDLDTTEKAGGISAAVGTVPVLVRLHDGVFNFLAGKEDGSDLKFIADDQKTVLKHHVEKWDSLLNEGYVWVMVPDVKPAVSKAIWMYYGNTTDAPAPPPAKETYDAETSLVYHFADAGKVGADSSASGVSSEGAASVSGSVIAGGLRLLSSTAVTIPASPSQEWTAGGNLTWSAWIKPAAASATVNATIFSRREGANSFVVGIDNGVAYVEVNKAKSTPGAPVSAGAWHHLAVTVGGGNATLYVDGKTYGSVGAALPALKGPSIIGKEGAGVGIEGELDELQIAKIARSAGWIQFSATNQGTAEIASRLLILGAEDRSDHVEESEIMKHVTLITDISKDLTFDGWVVIFLCALLAVVGWLIAVGKILYLNAIEKATKEFLKRWEKISGDLTAIDSEDENSIKTLGGTANAKSQKLMRKSPLYQIYHLGAQEISNRLKPVRKLTLDNEEKKTVPGGLSGRSIQAIKATLHGGLVREVQKLNGKLVFLTIGIAGGPYLGLLGTVIGVMITFAVIAKSGEVEVNSIAPGIAGALLATVAGLAVAIPALFIYSYLAARIKDVVTNMETFIDEFIAKMAEHHKES